MIAGQHAQPARIDRHRLGEAVLHREISHGAGLAASVEPRLVPVRGDGEVFLEITVDAIHMRKKALVLGDLVQTLLRDAAQRGHRVVP